MKMRAYQVNQIDRFLFGYSLAFSLLIVIVALANNPPGNILAITALFMPVPALLISDAFTILRRGIKNNSSPTPSPTHFKIIPPKAHPLLLLILTLYGIALLIVVTKTSGNASAELTSPVPLSSLSHNNP